MISESIARIRSQVKVLHAGRLCPTQAAVDLSSAALPRDPRTKAKWQEIKAESTGQCRFDFLQSIDVKLSQKPGIYNTFQRAMVLQACLDVAFCPVKDNILVAILPGRELDMEDTGDVLQTQAVYFKKLNNTPHQYRWVGLAVSDNCSNPLPKQRTG